MVGICKPNVCHRIDGLEVPDELDANQRKVCHRIDGLEEASKTFGIDLQVCHRIDGSIKKLLTATIKTSGKYKDCETGKKKDL